MGQCMSRKAAGAFAASTAAVHSRPTKMKKHQGSSDEDNKELHPKKPSPLTKGVAMSFGFKKRPTTAPSIASNAQAARRLANAVDGNGNDGSDTAFLTANSAPSGRSTPRLVPPKKEPFCNTRGSRFGFRQGQTNRMNKVADLKEKEIGEFGNANNNIAAELRESPGRNGPGNVDNNRNRVARIGIPQPIQLSRFTMQTTQLPRPIPLKIETKTAKTLANHNRKAASRYNQEDNSSKDGSLTEDSGVGSHHSGYLGDNDTCPELERLDSSPSYGRRTVPKRNLELVPKGSNKFDVRDLDDSTESLTPLPQLPSSFSSSDNSRIAQHSGIVRERTMQYQRRLNTDLRRKISVTSSEGFSEGEEEKTVKDDIFKEKLVSKPQTKSFLKNYSSPASSDEQDWMQAGEAMADDVSFSLSSSDESRDKEREKERAINSLALKSFMSMSLTKSLISDKPSFLEDSKFAAVAAASNRLLDDEILSPIDSILSYSENDEFKKRMTRSSSNSKDINEKLTPPSPGTPTNASNSLSLSDGKDDFLIDDEIADQPALVFEETITVNQNDNSISISQSQTSENTPTIVDSTPKPKRRNLQAFEGSPLLARNKKLLKSRTGSLDTLSPCESIASDDLMMDFEYSQSSGLEDCDRHNEYSSLDETLVRHESKEDASIRDWSSLLLTGDKVKNASRSRLLKSRTSTPNSIPDSPKSLDSRLTGRSRLSSANSPIRPRLGSHLSSTGYDSDDSIRLDRANHTAMKQDIISIKTMLLKLRRVLNEQSDEELLLRSETHNPFESQQVLTNGLFTNPCSSETNGEDQDDARIELAELRRQVLFLQGQLEDKDKTLQQLQDQMIKLANANYHSNSAPASTCSEYTTCNAATQTERTRPISAGPSLVNGSTDGSVGSLVSASEGRRSRPPIQDGPSKRTPSRLWRKPGEPASPPRYTSSSIPRRANSRSRAPSTPT